MLPATLAQEVKKQVQHYVEATFPLRGSGHLVPNFNAYSGNLWLQLQALILAADQIAWRQIAEHISSIGLFLLAGRGIAGEKADLWGSLDIWQVGEKPSPVTGGSSDPFFISLGKGRI